MQESTTRHSMEPVFIKVQALAGIMFFTFLVLHLANTALAAFGYEIYNTVQTTLRLFYQFPVFELLFVILPLVAHVIAGISLIFIRKKNERSNPPPKLSIKHRMHSIAGFFLLAVVFAHVLATRGFAYFLDAAPGFEGISFTLWFMPFYFYPYYFLLFMAGFYHSQQGANRIFMRYSGIRIVPALSKRLNQAAALAVVAALLGFGGILFDIPDPSDNDYARQYARLLNLDINQAQ